MDENLENSSLERFGYEQSLKRVLPLSRLIFFGLAYLAPMTIFSTYGLVTSMTHGMISLSYAVATFAMAFTAYSYGRMAAAYPIAGSAYSYTQRSINPHIGFLTGWGILMDYLLLPMINALLAAIFLKAYLPEVPGWVWIVIYIVFATIVNYFGINVTTWITNIVIVLQIIFIGVFVLFIVKWLVTGHGAATFFDWSAFFNAVEFHKPGMGWGIIFSGASILALSFLGFDAVTSVSEEAINPEKNVGRAIMITCVGAGIMFIVVSYLMQLSWPSGWNEFKVADSGAQEVILKVAGTFLWYAFIVILNFGGLACQTASQASAARILFGMGRDGVLPKKFFGYVHPKYKVPTYNLFLIAVICLLAVVMSLGIAASLVNFGALLGFTMVNLSVIAHYFIKHKIRSGFNVVRYLVAPLIGAGFCFTIWLNLDVNSKILGFCWMAVGIVYLAITTNFFRRLPPELKLEE